MAESKKFTQEEIDQITSIREENAQKISEFGQTELELLITEERLNQLREFKTKLHAEFKDLQTKESDLVTKLNEKYGKGIVDVNTGEFVPEN